MGCILVSATFKHQSLINYDAGWMAQLGRISYGIYLFHMFGIVFACKISSLLFKTENSYWVTCFICVTTFMLSILFGELSYRYFETYFLRLKKHYRKVQTEHD